MSIEMAKNYELTNNAVAALTTLVTLTICTSTVLAIKKFRVPTEHIYRNYDTKNSKENNKEILSL